MYSSFAVIHVPATDRYKLSRPDQELAGLKFLDHTRFADVIPKYKSGL